MAHPDRDITAELVEWLRARADCVLDPGLSEAELDRAERVLELTVAPRWRAVLRLAHPVARPGSAVRFPDWRLGDEPALRALVDAPVGGVLFDVEQNAFWWHAWGPMPDSVEQRMALARQKLAGVPRLTPLVGHWYVADCDGSPVFSIVQADLYVPALSLPDLVEGRGEDDVPAAGYPIGTVPFWSELHAYSQLGHLDGGRGRFGRLASGGM